MIYNNLNQKLLITYQNSISKVVLNDDMLESVKVVVNLDG